jgi:hypothetical protein
MQFTKNNVTAYKDEKLPLPLAVSAGADWADGLRVIGAAQAEILLAALQSLYPHRDVSQIVYRRVVLRFDAMAAGVAPAGAMFVRFCEMLDAAWPVGFCALADSYRVAVLKSVQESAEFVFVQRLGVRFLYDDIEVWAAFGYEGASVHLGGYVGRGFNDLDWLPPLPNDL